MGAAGCKRAAVARKHPDKQRNSLPPLRGGVRGGGVTGLASWAAATDRGTVAMHLNRDDPSPYPLPQGEGEFYRSVV